MIGYRDNPSDDQIRELVHCKRWKWVSDDLRSEASTSVMAIGGNLSVFSGNQYWREATYKCAEPTPFAWYQRENQSQK